MTTATQSGRGKQQSGRRSQAASQRGTRTKATSEAEQARGEHRTRVDLPFVTAEFHVPEMHMPGTQDWSNVADSVRSRMPSTQNALFYGGLAAGTAFAFIEWPVALAIGVGHALLTQDKPEEKSPTRSGEESGS